LASDRLDRLAEDEADPDAGADRTEAGGEPQLQCAGSIMNVAFEGHSSS
jgi:hypothetical protein